MFSSPRQTTLGRHFYRDVAFSAEPILMRSSQWCFVLSVNFWIRLIRFGCFPVLKVVAVLMTSISYEWECFSLQYIPRKWFPTHKINQGKSFIEAIVINILTAIGFTDFLYLFARILLDLLSTLLFSTKFLAAASRSFAGRRRMLYCISDHLLRHCEQLVDCSLRCFLDDSTLPHRDLLFEKKKSIFNKQLIWTTLY